MKNKLLFNLLTPFATSYTQGKTFRNLLNTFAIVMLLGANGVMGQGAEDFSNIPTSNVSYLSRSWTGTNSVTWTATLARTDQSLTGRAICTDGSGTVTSPTYSGGMGTLQFNYVRAFTGTNARSIEVYVNSVKQGSTITVSPSSNTVVAYSSALNITGNVILELRTSGSQIKIDDIQWTGYSATTPIFVVTGTTAHGSTCVYTAATTKTYTITNTGTAASNLVVSSSDAQFVVSNLSSTSIGATNGTATYDVTFTPSSSGAKTATITVYYDTSTSATTSSLTGTGTTPATAVVTSNAASSLGTTTATLNGNVNTLGVCPTTTQKGFVFSLTSASATPTNGDGVSTTTSVSSLVTGAYTLSLTGLTQGTSYSFRAYVFDGITYTYGSVTTFTTLVPPANDDCSNASTLTINAASTSGNNALATKSNPTSLTGSAYTTGTAKDMWYIFTPTCSGSHTISLTPTGFDGAVALFTGGTCPNPTFTSVMDDGATGTAETITFTATANITYRILVWGYNSTSGSFTIGVTTPTLAVTTSAASSITTTGATLNGNVTTLCPNITEIGFVYSLTSTNNNPLNAGTGVTKVSVTSVEGAFTNTLTGLTTSVGYSYKAYAFDGTTYTYGSVQTFTPSNVPSIIYQHDFGTTAITSKPYTGAPGTFASNLSNSSWTASGAFTDLNGSTGKAIGFSAVSSGPYTLTFNVANGYQLSVSSYSYWRQTSSSASVSSITINGTTITSGASAAPTTGTNIGTTNVANTISGLTGTITVVLNITGSGSFRLDDFTLNGNVLLATNNWTGGTGNWNTPANWSLSQVPLTTDNITISSGSPVMDVNHTVAAGRTLTISGTGSLTINPSSSLTIAGDVDFGGKLVTIKSTSAGSGSIGQISGTLTGATNVTTERYIPSRRAYRFLSPAVTTSTTIRQNWQENGGTAAGLGTHITGTGGATNGFDPTETNNSSLLLFTNGTWVGATSTNVSLTAGNAYCLMVRGDRTTDLTTNTPATSNTVLRATGTLFTGNFSPVLSAAASGYSFIGNPYQAPLDIKTALQSSTDVNKNVVYYWDPTINARGGYITRNLQTSQNIPSSSVNDYVQPGQAFFVVNEPTLTSTPALTFTENHKSVANAAAGVFRNANTNEYGTLRVNLQANPNNQWTTIDGALAIFNDTFSWNVTSEDATKMANLDEEVSFVQNNTSLAIALQSNPSATSELPIKIGKMRHTNYKWQFELDNYDGATPYLFDTLNNSYTQINNGTVVPFIADANTTNRFKVVFQNAVLSNTTFQNTLAIYPNPAKAGASFYVEGISEATVTVSNLLGQTVPVQTKSQGTTLQVTPNTSLSQGVYLVNITTQGTTQQVKWIVE